MENREGTNNNNNNNITTTGLIQNGREGTNNNNVTATGLIQNGREGTNNNNVTATGLIEHGGPLFPRGLHPIPRVLHPPGLFPPHGYPMEPPRPEIPNHFPVGQPSTRAAVAVQPSVNADPSFSFTMPVENSSSALQKRKRGRPRKYYPEGLLPQTLSRMPISSFVPNADGGPSLTSHVLIVNAGEDVTREIMKFAQQGSQAICILSATGPISSVILRRPMSSGGTVTYEGHYEILSLNGSFIPSENGGTQGRAGGMSVCLAKPGGTLFGGRLAGFLIAAGRVEVVLLSFVTGQEESQQPQQQIKKQRREGPGSPATTPFANISSGGSEEDPNARLNKPVVLQPRPVSASTDLIQPGPVSESPVSFSHGPSTDTVHADYRNDSMMEDPLTSHPSVDEKEDEDEDEDFQAEGGVEFGDNTESD